MGKTEVIFWPLIILYSKNFFFLKSLALFRGLRKEYKHTNK